MTVRLDALYEDSHDKIIVEVNQKNAYVGYRGIHAGDCILPIR